MPVLSSEQLEQLHQQLLGLQLELQQVLEQLHAGTAPVQLDQAAVGRVSRMDAISQQSMLLANQQQAKEHLLQVREALRRMAESDYGFCLQCDEPIALRRLQVRPEADLCLGCQSVAELG